MKILCLVFAVASLALVASTSTRGVKPQVSNHLGDLIAEVIYEQLGKFGDPFLVVGNLSVPINLNDSSIIISGAFNVSDVQLHGLSTVQVTDSVASVIPNISATFGFHVPELLVTGNYVVDGSIETSLFPLSLHGDGPFSIRVSENQLDAGIKLKIKPDLHLEISELLYGLDVYQIGIRIEGLLNDVDPKGEINEAVNIVLNSYLSILFNMYEAQLHDVVRTAITLVANLVLANLTLADLISLIGGGGGAPF